MALNTLSDKDNYQRSGKEQTESSSGKDQDNQAIAGEPAFFQKNKGWILFACCMVFFLAMGIWNLMHSDLWGDEWVEYTISMQSLKNGQMYDSILTTFQPPLYNWIMHFWLKISDSIVWFRLFNLIPAAFSGFFLFFSVRRLSSVVYAAISLLMLSVGFIWIYMLQECSEYTLMMAFVFGQIYFFIRCYQKYSRLLFTGFIFCAIGAMYSQYGAVFAVVPMAAALWLHFLIKKERRAALEITIGYVIALILFALPLYWFFARDQIANNEISQHMGGSLSLWGYLSSFGLLIEYFMLYRAPALEPAFVAAGILLLTGIICFLVLGWKRRNTAWIIVFMLLVSYTLLYIAVELHIYAMIHANESRGLFFRYSDCVLPLFYTAIPVLFFGLSKVLKKKISPVIIRWALVLILAGNVLIGGLSFTRISANWTKSHENEFLQIWAENDGEQTPTLFLGRMAYNSRYYFEKNNLNDSLVLEDISQMEDNIIEEKPETFFVLRSVWGGEEDLERIEAFARENGYSEKIRIEYPVNGSLDYGGTLIKYIR